MRFVKACNLSPVENMQTKIKNQFHVKKTTNLHEAYYF